MSSTERGVHPQTTSCSRRDPKAILATAENRLVNLDEVAVLLSCSSRTVYRYKDQGLMPRPIKLRGLVRWPLKQIEAWINAGCPKQVMVEASNRKKG